jgi:hypothetical protein
MDPSPYEPPQRPGTPTPEGGRDSMGYGFGMGCLAIVLATVAYAIIGGLFFAAVDSTAMAPVSVLLLVLALAPIAAPIVLAVRMRGQGRLQSSKGVFAALLTAVGLGVLLVGACFGLLSTADFR